MTYKIQIDDLVRDATPDEIAEIELRAQVEADRLAAKAAEEKAKTDAKAAAQAKLAKLGLTVEDLTALGL